MITDRDSVVRWVAEGSDPASVRVGDLADDKLGDLVEAIAEAPPNG